MSTKKFSLEQLIQIYKNSKDMQLRSPDESVVAEYAEQMKAGSKFPPMIIGVYPEDDERKEMFIDGVHRLMAMVSSTPQKAHKNVDVTVEYVEYKNAAVALGTALRLNVGRGLSVSPADRNRRIRLLAAKFKWNAGQIADLVGLSRVSCHNILSGKAQGEGKPGVQTGTKREKKEIKSLKSADAIAQISRLVITMKHEGTVLGMKVKLAKYPTKNAIGKDIVELGQTLIGFGQDLCAHDEDHFVELVDEAEEE